MKNGEYQMVRFKCRICGAVITMPQKIDTDCYEDISTDKYDGIIDCPTCKLILHVKLVKGKLEKCEIVENKTTDANRKINITVRSEEAKELTEGVEEFGIFNREEEQREE